MTQQHRILVGDCIEMMRTLPDQSVHTCITSPPYFGLRDYGVDGQIGLEASPREFIDSLKQFSAKCAACCVTTARSG